MVMTVLGDGPQSGKKKDRVAIMLTLSQAEFIAKGLHRECYIHPQDAKLCIKVIYDAGGIAETRREINYYKHLQRRLSASWSALPRYHGTLATNRGTGYLFDLIRDANGNISRTLEHYLASAALSEQHFPDLLVAFQQLKHTLFNDRIITMILKSKNILYRVNHDTPNDLIIVDNIGDATLIPLASYLPWFARQKIQRTWQRFICAILAENPTNPALVRLINNLEAMNG